MTEIVDLPLDTIRTDGGTQSREHLDEEAVREYTAAYTRGDALPEPDVFFDGSDYWLAGGFHRYHGRRGAGFPDMPCRVHQGTRRDAVLFAAGENATHGIRRSNGDKRKAVTMLLEDEEWSGWSDRKIADQCHVSKDLVGDIRRSLTVSSDSDEPPPKRKFTTKHGTEAVMQTAKIGQRKPEATPATDVASTEKVTSDTAEEVPLRRLGPEQSSVVNEATAPAAGSNPYLDEPEPAGNSDIAKAKERALESLRGLVRYLGDLGLHDDFRQWLDVIHRRVNRISP